MKTIVVNVHKEPYDVCIMRLSIYQNKYHIGKDGTREEVIEKFRVDFEERIQNDPVFRVTVENLRRKRIGCCCTPAACHGDVYAEFLNRGYDEQHKEPHNSRYYAR